MLGTASGLINRQKVCLPLPLPFRCFLYFAVRVMEFGATAASGDSGIFWLVFPRLQADWLSGLGLPTRPDQSHVPMSIMSLHCGPLWALPCRLAFSVECIWLSLLLSWFCVGNNSISHNSMRMRLYYFTGSPLCGLENREFLPGLRAPSTGAWSGVVAEEEEEFGQRIIL